MVGVYMESTQINGVINVLKPPGMTSHDVIYFIRRNLKVKKAGHTGTLDPGVAGVLPVCVGKGTKVIEYLEHDMKVYRAEATLGKATDTQDGFGTTTGLYDASHLTEEAVLDKLNSFLGEQFQIPPMVSAVKHKGKKLYELAREGISVEREPRKVHIFDISVIKLWDFGTPQPKILFDVKCSKGTYVRTLCHDLGEKLGCGGFMSFLIRSATGMFHMNEALTLEEIKEIGSAGGIGHHLTEVGKVLPLQAVWVKESSLGPLQHGNRIYMPGISSMPEDLSDQQLVKLMNEKMGCLAVARFEKDIEITDSAGEKTTGCFFQPVKVF